MQGEYKLSHARRRRLAQLDHEQVSAQFSCRNADRVTRDIASAGCAGAQERRSVQLSGGNRD